APDPDFAAGHRAVPDPHSSGRHPMPDADFGPGRGAMPEADFGPGGRRGAPEPDFPPAPGQASGYRSIPDPHASRRIAPDPDFAAGHRAIPDPHSSGRHPMPDADFGPGHPSHRPMPDADFGPGGRRGGPDPDFPGGADFSPGHAGRRGAPDAGFPAGPGQASGYRAAPDPHAAGRGAMPDAGQGHPSHRPMPEADFGPGNTGRRPMPAPDFGPGHTGRSAMPDADFGAGPAGRPMPEADFGPGRGAMPEADFGGRRSAPDPDFPPAPGQAGGYRAGPDSHATGDFPPGPGQASIRRAVPGRPGPDGELPPAPGQATGQRPFPTGQATGGRPLPTGRRPGELEDRLGEHSGPRPHPAAPAEGEQPPAAGQRSRPTESGAKGVPLPPPRRPEDAISMTTEMEAIGEEVQKRRSIDHTLARFSAVHDELKAEERVRKAKRRKLLPWQHDDAEMDKLDELVGMQTIAVPQKPEPEAAIAELPPSDGGDGGGATRLQEKKTRRRDKSALAVRVFAATAAILVFVATGVAWGFKAWVDASSQEVDALDPDSAAIQDAAKQQGDENFLLVGSDTRAGASAEEGVGDESDIVGARSDTVMIAHIPANRERAVIVSFPRDLEVDRPRCEGWDPKSGDYTGEQKDAAQRVKLNTAYQVGGPKCVTKLVQELSGLAINHFVGIDFHGFKGMVDAVRGVEVCVEQPLRDDVLGTVVPVAGKNITLSGDQALNFVRARHVEGDLTSDYGRIKRQQRFLSSLLRKAMSTEVLLDPGKLTGFVEAFSKSTFGDNIGVDQMMLLGESLQGIEAGRVTFVTVPTVGESNSRGNEDLRVEDTDALFAAIRNDAVLPGEKPASKSNNQQQAAAGLRQQSQPVDPKSVKLQVFNGGNPTGGIAGSTADELAALGFQIVWVDTAPETVKKTVIKYAKGSEAAAQTVRAAVPAAELVEDPSLVGAVQLVIGPGFDGEVVSPKGGGKPAPPPLPADLSTINGGDVSCA
ncbi:MAG TPA: LCP family protein, partial [Actinophytocola sp.]|nr:LCP family protein [Actinophytocola sp.]